MIRKFFKIGILGLFGIFLGLFITIALDRTLGFFLNKYGYFKAHPPERIGRFDTNEFEADVLISKQGLRNETVQIPKPRGVFRILAIGDSFTFGWGVNLEDTWVKKLQQMYQSAGKKVEIVNAGVPGIAQFSETHICQAYKNQLDIDLIILGFYGTDDMYQNAARYEAMDLTSYLIDFLTPTLSRLNNPVIDASQLLTQETTYSYLPQVLKNKIQPIPTLQAQTRKELPSSTYFWSRNANIMVAQNPQILKMLDPALLPDFLNGKLNPAIVGFAYMDKEYLTKMLNVTNREFALVSVSKSLTRLQTRCAGNTPVVFLFIPGNQSVSKAYHPYRQSLGYEIDDRLLSINFDEYFKPIVENAGMKYLSLLEYFRQTDCDDCYYKLDCHFTQKGNLKTAEFLYQNLGNIIPELK
jgi:hypothetical protein